MRARSSSWSDRQVEALLVGRGEPGDADLIDLLRDLRRLATGPVPEPSSALEAILNGELPLPATIAAVPPRSRNTGRRRLRAAALLLVATLGVTTAGAAANALPAPAQRAAARVLNAVTFFHFPTPRAPARPPAPAPAPAPPAQVPSLAPGPANPPAPPHPTAAANRDDGDGREQGTPVVPREPAQSSASDDATSTRTSDQESSYPGTSGASSSEGSLQEPAPAPRQSWLRPESAGGVEPSSDSSATDEPG